jgi:hypothetical protein
LDSLPEKDISAIIHSLNILEYAQEKLKTSVAVELSGCVGSEAVGFVLPRHADAVAPEILESGSVFVSPAPQTYLQPHFVL